jgi:hypothetical protein
MRSREEDVLVGRDAFRGGGARLFPVAASVEKKSNFIPMMFLCEFVQHSPLP